MTTFLSPYLYSFKHLVYHKIWTFLDKAYTSLDEYYPYDDFLKRKINGSGKVVMLLYFSVVKFIDHIQYAIFLLIFCTIVLQSPFINRYYGKAHEVL